MQIGTDLVEIARIQAVAERKPDFAARILSPNEFARYVTFPAKRQAEFLAGRFAAKEAYGKAIGTGIGTRLKFDQISIEPTESGAPQVVAGPITQEARVSISHSEHYATAFVLIECDDATIQTHCDRYFRKESTDV